MNPVATTNFFSFGIFYGVAISAMLFNLFFYFVNREKTNLLFVFYTLATVFYFTTLDDIGKSFIWKSYPSINEYVNEFSELASIVFLLLYTRAFLHMDENHPKLNRLIVGYLGARIILYLLETFNVISNPLVSLVFDAVAFGFAYLYGYISLRRGYKPSIYYLIGFTCLFIGFISNQIMEVYGTNLARLERTVDISFHIGFIFQLMLQTLALTVRYKVLDNEQGEYEKKEERAKSWNMLMDILDYIPHQIFLKDSKHRMVLMNKRVGDVLHLSRKEVLGKTDFDFFDKAVAEKYYQNEVEMLASGKPSIIPEFIFYGPNGENRIFNSTKLPFYIPEFKEMGLLGIEIEITESKKIERELLEKNEHIEGQRREIEDQRKKIADLFEDVKDSIKTAKMIQEAIMPNERVIAEHFHEYFTLYLPKDIVSGDFYWFKNLDYEEKIMFATVDCTGHGVAGAFISIIANNLLNKITDSRLFNSPADVLNKLNVEMMQALNQGPDSENGSHDGMDITLCVYDPELKTLQFAGACSQLCLIRNNELSVYKTDHFSIGYLNNKKRTFSNFAINVIEGDILYIYSDGYAGQFGGHDGMQKFMYNRLRDLLLKISPLPMKEQREILRSGLEKWRGEQEQTDDVMVLGFKF